VSEPGKESIIYCFMGMRIYGFDFVKQRPGERDETAPPRKGAKSTKCWGDLREV
jgi:hypothetical protein